MTELLGELFSIEGDFKFDEPKQRDGLEMMLTSNSTRCVIVAEDDGKVIGMCSVQKVVSTAEGSEAGLVEDLIVTKNYRRQNVGSTLIAAVEKWARQQGIKRIQLLADKGNVTALDFYSARGWQTTDLICLRKNLED